MNDGGGGGGSYYYYYYYEGREQARKEAIEKGNRGKRPVKINVGEVSLDLWSGGKSRANWMSVGV